MSSNANDLLLLRSASGLKKAMAAEKTTIRKGKAWQRHLILKR